MKNNVILEGNLTRDAEMKFTPNGKASLKLSIAYNEKPYTKNGQEVKPVSFFDVQAWGQTAEDFAWMKKGQRVEVEGILKQDRWEKDGRTNSRVYILAFSISAEKKTSHHIESSHEQKAPDGFSDDIPGDESIPF